MNEQERLNIDIYLWKMKVTNQVFANIAGYSVLEKLVIDTNTDQSLIRLFTGSNGGASVPVDKRFEFYVSSASMFKEITK